MPIKNPDLWEYAAYPPHTWPDVDRHNENVRAGRDLCVECEGTGNMFLSMHKTCSGCAGSGVEDSTSERASQPCCINLAKGEANDGSSHS